MVTSKAFMLNKVSVLSFPIVAASLGAATMAQAQMSNDDGEVVREARPSQSVENVLREEHALFSDRLTIEPGINYS